ncbi:hypothetical protein PSI19_15845 [Xenorhabdus khoisanae]|nr:hypothetical protein [Xenorhabdus khoisanae]
MPFIFQIASLLAEMQFEVYWAYIRCSGYDQPEGWPAYTFLHQHRTTSDLAEFNTLDRQ